MTLFISVLAVIVGGLLAIGWFVHADPRSILRAIRWIGLIFAVLIVVVVAYTGRINLLIAALALLIPWIARMRAVRNAMKSARGPTAGQASEVRTRFVIMQLNHDSGEMDGIVQEGPYAGRSLSDMPLEAVIELTRAAMAADQQSAQVLQAYLDRMHGPDWQDEMGGTDREQKAGAASGGPMSRNEACEVLGVGRDATEEEIKRAHRRLMQQFHPDHGGSDYLAARINEAKEVLLGER